MDLKKLGIWDQFPSGSASKKRKVVSGFGLGVFASFIVLTVVLFNVSFSTPFLNPIFQGFNHSGNTSLLSWPFSFSTVPPPLPPPPPSSSSSSSGGAVQSVNLMKSDTEGGVADTAHEANPSNLTQNGSFVIEEGFRVQESNQVVGGAEIGKNGSLSVLNGGDDSRLGKTHLGNFSENANLTGGSGTDLLGGNHNVTVNNGENATNPTMSEPESPITDHVPRVSDGECDIFNGGWVRDDSKPYYPAGSCPYIDRDFDCHLNRRPDDGYVRWKWQPYGCDIPSLNATDFLERLRGKKLVFVGDSLNRNMWESLVCILRNSVKNKKRVYEISGRRDFKKKGFYAFRFEDYECTVDFVGTPFLVRESSFKGQNGTFETLRLDLMDRTTSMYRDADVLVFNTGHWWTHEKTSRGEDYYQEGNHVYPRLKVLEAYKRGLSTWARWVDKNIDSSRTQVIFRGYSVTHFRGGRWNSGGQCHKETEPIFNQSYLPKYPSKMKALENVLREMKTPVIYLNISRLTGHRKDAHPSIYRKEYKSVEEEIAAEQSQDCSHWCLPGVPDTWNELLYASLLKVGKGSWRS